MATKEEREQAKKEFMELLGETNKISKENAARLEKLEKIMTEKPTEEAQDDDENWPF
jgi:hypothetical protein